MLSVSYWTRIAVSISYDDNDYTTGTSKYIYKYFIQGPDNIFRTLWEKYFKVVTSAKTFEIVST